MLAAGAGSIEAVVVQPLIFTKVIKQSNQSVLEIVKRDGIRAFYRGTIPFVSQMIPKYFVRFYTYEGSKNHIGNFAAGFLAGTCESICVICPFENIKTKMQTNPKIYPDVLTSIKVCLEKKGFKGIYSGLSATIARQSINQASNFTTYAYLRRKYPDPRYKANHANGNYIGVSWTNHQQPC